MASRSKWAISLLCGIAGCAVGFSAMRALNRVPEPTSLPANGPAQLIEQLPIAEEVTHFSEYLRMEAILLSPASSAAKKLRILKEMESKGMEIWSALHAFAHHDPEAYIKFQATVELGGDWRMASQLLVAFEVLFEKNPDLAESLAASYPRAEGRSGALGLIVREGILKGDSAEGKRLLAVYSSELSEGFFRTWPKFQHEPFAAVLATLPNTRHSTEIARDFAVTWFEQDPAAAKRWAKELPPGIVRDFTFGYLLQHMTRHNPDQAAEFYAEITEQFTDWHGDAYILTAISEHLFADDIEGGLEWAKDHLPVAAQTSFYAKLAAHSFDEEGADAAVALLSEIPPAQHGSIVKAITSKMMGVEGTEVLDFFGSPKIPAQPPNWPEVVAWSESLNGRRSNFAKSHIAKSWAFADIESAKEHLSSAESAAFPQLTEEVAVKWAESDPDAALDWIESLPPEHTGKALERAVRTWLQNQPLAAAQYVLTLPEGKQRSELVSTTGWQLVTRDPEGAEAWLRSMETAEDKAAAKSTIGGADAEHRERLRSILEGTE